MRWLLNGHWKLVTSFLKVAYFSDLATDSGNNIGLARTGFSVRCCGK